MIMNGAVCYIIVRAVAVCVHTCVGLHDCNRLHVFMILAT